MTQNVTLEICIDSVASAVASERGGAERVELCSNLPEGGVTPSAGMIAAVRSAVALRLHVIVRPRAGDFCYSEREIDVMCHDVESAKALGADGVVLGILDPSGHVDVARTRRLVDLARPMPVTFHRAFDMTDDLFRALEDVCAAGVQRVLTSGGEGSAMDGAENIARLIAAAKARVSIMAGGGIRVHNAQEIVRRTGVREIHAGLSAAVESSMKYRKPQVVMGKNVASEYQHLQVLEQDVAALRTALSA